MPGSLLVLVKDTEEAFLSVCFFVCFSRRSTVSLVLLEVQLLEYFVLECSLVEQIQGYVLIFIFSKQVCVISSDTSAVVDPERKS